MRPQGLRGLRGGGAEAEPPQRAQGLKLLRVVGDKVRQACSPVGQATLVCCAVER
jgi:hypothetical protein